MCYYEKKNGGIEKMSVFKNRLRALRLAEGYTQDELADALGFSRSSIGMYEQGRREPNFETIEILADFFNVDVDFLIGKSDKTTKILVDYNVDQNTNIETVKRIRRLNELVSGADQHDLDSIIVFAEMLFKNKEKK